MIRRTCQVEIDDATREVAKAFDYQFDGTITTECPDFTPPSDFSIGLIVGSSGSGKSTLLTDKFGAPELPVWLPNRSIVSQVGWERLSGVGLNSVPSWCKPRHVLSTGEGFRADMAASLRNDARIDEFTSTVDRTVAIACSAGVRRLVDRLGLRRVVLASCHRDIVEWLQPDWVYDTDSKVLVERGFFQRPPIKLEIEPCKRSAWSIFAPHHYLSSTILNSSRCWCVWWGNKLVGFTSVIAFPHGVIKKAWREHRTVVLPDFQGMGIGVRISDAIANHYVTDLGCRFFSKTAHPRMGEYRDRHPRWRSTSASRVSDPRAKRGAVVKSGRNMKYENMYHRVCWSHEFV
jgi:hypothetical protein